MQYPPSFRQRIAPIMIGCLFASALTGCLPSPDSSSGASSGKLQAILKRGKLNCGVSGELPGFSFVNPEGEYSGLDVDFCRAIASALFDDPNAVNYRRLNAKERFTAVQTGEIDVLSRNTTWTLSRDGSNRMAFAPVVFYDGQGMMVRQNSGIKTLKDFAGKAVCTQTGTTNEQNLSDQMRKLGVDYTQVVFEDINAAYQAYTEDRCQGVTSDRSQLLSRRSAFPKPNEHIILEEVMSKEPLAPAVIDGDSQWLDAVTWVIYSTIEAEDLGLRSDNLDQFTGSKDPVIKRFLGTEDSLGDGIGLPNDFAARVVKNVGNYAEIYDRNLGPKTKLNLPRGQNKLWQDGGLLYSPPFR